MSSASYVENEDRQTGHELREKLVSGTESS